MDKPASLASAVAGTGFIGPIHVEALRRLGRPVAGILGSSPLRGREAAARLGLPRAYGSLEELLADPAVGTVHLATPNRLHFAQCKQVLAAGKHVLVEKPLAMTSAEAAELEALAARSGRVAAVCYNVRFYPQNLDARVRLREMGRLHHVVGSYLQDWLLDENDFNWRVEEPEGGASRAVADIGTHWLDLVQFVTGDEVASVCADLRTVHEVRYRPADPVETFQATSGERIAMPVATEDCANILLRFRSGASGCLAVSQVAAGRKNCLRWEASAATGSLAWNSERPEELWLGRRGEPNGVSLRDPALLAREARPFASCPGGHAEGFADTFKQLFRAVYAAIDGEPADVPFPTFKDGLREILCVESILTSHRERRWIDLDPM